MLGEATVSFQSQQPDGTEDFAQMKRRTVQGTGRERLKYCLSNQYPEKVLAGAV